MRSVSTLSSVVFNGKSLILPLALYPANSVFVSGYLTTPGQSYQETWQMIEDPGFEIQEYAEASTV